MMMQDKDLSNYLFCDFQAWCLKYIGVKESLFLLIEYWSHIGLVNVKHVNIKQDAQQRYNFPVNVGWEMVEKWKGKTVQGKT